MEQAEVKSPILNQKVIIIGGVAGAGVIGLIILLFVIFTGGGETPQVTMQKLDHAPSAPVPPEQFSENTQNLVSELTELIKLTEKPEEEVKMADLPSETLSHASKVAEEELRKVAKTLPKAQADALKDLCNNAKVTLQSQGIIKALKSDENKVPTIQEIGTLKKAEELGTKLKPEIQEVIGKAITELKVPYKDLTLFLARPDACYGKLDGNAMYQFKEVQKNEEKANSLPGAVKRALKLLKKQVALKAKAIRIAGGKEKHKSVRTLEKLIFMSPELGLEQNQVDALQASIKTLKSKMEQNKGDNESAKEESSSSSSSEDKSEKPDANPEGTDPAKSLEPKPSIQQNGQRVPEETNDDDDDDDESETVEDPQKSRVAKEHVEKFKKAMESLFAPGYDYTKLNENFKTAVDEYLAEVKKTGPAPISETNKVLVNSEEAAFNYVYLFLRPIEKLVQVVGDSAFTDKTLGIVAITQQIYVAYRKDPVKGAKIYDAAVLYYDFFLMRGDKNALEARVRLPFLKRCEEFLATLKPLLGPEDMIFYDGMANLQLFDSNDLFPLLHLIIKTYGKQTDRTKSNTFLEEYLAETAKHDKGLEGPVIARIIPATLSALKVHEEIIKKGVKEWDVQKLATSLSVKDVTDGCGATDIAGCKFLLEKTNEYFALLATKIFKELIAEWFEQGKKTNIYTALMAAAEKYHKARIMLAKYELLSVVTALGIPGIMDKIEAFESGDDYFDVVKELAKKVGHENLFVLIKKYFEAHYYYFMKYKPGAKPGAGSPATTAANQATYNMKLVIKRYSFGYYDAFKELQASYGDLQYGFQKLSEYSKGILNDTVNVSMMILAADPDLFATSAKADDHKKVATRCIWIDKLISEKNVAITDKTKANAAFAKFHTEFIKQTSYFKKVVQRNFLKACQMPSEPKPIFKLKDDGTLDTADLLDGVDPGANLTTIVQEAVDGMNAYAAAKGLKPAVKDFKNLDPSDLPTPYDALCKEVETLENDAIKALYDQSIAELQ